MEKILADSLKDLGCSDKEVKFFIAGYKLGPATIINITKKAKIERSTAYLIAQSLISKGLIIEDLKQYRKILITVNPDTITRMLAARQRQIGRHELAIKENLFQLQSLYQASDIMPKVRTYEGSNGLVSVWKDILFHPQEVLLWTNQETENNFFSSEFHKSFIQERLKKNIPLRVLAVNNRKGLSLQKNDKHSNRITKLLPEKVTFSAETYIYGNKIAILDYNKDIIGIIIESQQITDSQRAIFEMTWQ